MQKPRIIVWKRQMKITLHKINQCQQEMYSKKLLSGKESHHVDEHWNDALQSCCILSEDKVKMFYETIRWTALVNKDNTLGMSM